LQESGLLAFFANAAKNAVAEDAAVNVNQDLVVKNNSLRSIFLNRPFF
jgi:hypothetical protein